MKTSLKIGAAYIGGIVGAGFASGQEILQYFTYYGWTGFLGILVGTILFAWLGYQLASLGSTLQSTSHKEAILQLGGRYFGTVVDYIIILACLNASVVMIAGGGSILNQLFNVPVVIGSIIVLVLVAITLCLDVQRIIEVIGSVTPFFVLMTIILAIYSLSTSDITALDMQQVAKPELTASPNWALSGVLYVSYNVIFAVALLTVMGGSVKDPKVAGMGGLIGGLGLGVLVLLMNLGLIVKLDQVSTVDMPTLLLAKEISPVLSIIMGLILFAMVFNTAAGGLYVFTTRFVNPKNKNFKLYVILFCLLAFVLSFVGFSKLVGTVYAWFGYLGITLMVIVFVQWIRHRNVEAPINEKIDKQA